MSVNQSVTLRAEHRVRVLEKTVLRKIPSGKRNKATGDWRRLHSGELLDLYSPANIIRVGKSRRKWLGHVARMWERRGTCRVWCRNLRERDHFVYVGIDVGIILK